MVAVLGSFIRYTAYCISGWQRLDMKSVPKGSRQMLHRHTHKHKNQPSRRSRSDCRYIMVYLSSRILNCCYVWLSWGLEPLNQPLINHLLAFTDEGCVGAKLHWALLHTPFDGLPSPFPPSSCLNVQILSGYVRFILWIYLIFMAK